MEINKFEECYGVVTTEDIKEGRFVTLVPSSESYDFGSREDLPGVALPANAEEAKRARFVLTWAVDNRPTPITESTPAYDFALREGFDRSANAPFSATVYLTHPGNQEGLTIPSGTPALAFSDGIFTVPSGAYVYSADIIKTGAAVIVSNVSDHSADAGKPRYAASEAVGVIAHTHSYDANTGALVLNVK